MKTLSARMLLSMSTAELWDSLIGYFKLKFEDGTIIETNYRETCYSSYVWDYLRSHPKTLILPRHHVSFHTRHKSITADTHKELIGAVLWDVIDTYQFHLPDQRDPLIKQCYEIVNNMYNDLSVRTEGFVISIDMVDFVNIVNHPTMKATLDGLDGNRLSIERANRDILHFINNDPSLDDNSLAMATRGRMVKSAQVIQCIGMRGSVTEVDGMFMPVPILRGFAKGMRTLYNQLAESRSAAKSHYFSENPLEDAEYFARRLQLLCMSIERLHHVDCGSTDYLLWHVNPPVFKDNKEVYPGDLKFLKGKYYLDETTNTLKEITGANKELYNKTIRMRSVLHCKHPDKHGVCAVCFGKLADNVNKEANIGHFCAATMTKQTSQSVLSVKHSDVAAGGEPILLNEISVKYFSVGRGGNTFLLNKSLKGKMTRFVVTQREAFGLTDVSLVNDVKDIHPSMISKIEMVGFEHTENGVVGNIVPITVSQQGRFATFTHEFMQYAKDNRWEVDSRGNYVFKLDTWDFTKPIMRLPDMEYSFSIHSNQVASIIESSKVDEKRRYQSDSPSSTLVELFNVVNSKLNVNIAALEVIILAGMIKDGQNDDFSLSRNEPTTSLGISNTIIKNRSLSAAYAYEDQAFLINDPISFFKLNRPDSVFDVFISPKEVVEHYRGKAV